MTRNLLIVVVALICNSCSKDDHKSLASGIYVGGYIQDSETGLKKATYWMNDSKTFTLPVQPLYEGFVYDLGINDYQLIAGGYQIPAPNTSGWNAVTWKDGTLSQLAGTVIYGVDISNSDVYLAGYESDGTVNNEVAKYWKNGNEFVVADFAKLTDIKSSGGSVYVCGMQKLTDFEVAAYWKDKTEYVLMGDSTDSYTTSIFVAGDDVYVTGYYSNAAGSYVSLLWKNGEVINNTEGAASIQYNAVFVTDATTYVAGTEFSLPNGGGKPRIWANNNLVALMPENIGGTAQDVFVSSGNVYVCGSYVNPSGFAVATYWKNGIRSYDLADASTYSGAFAITVK